MHIPIVLAQQETHVTNLQTTAGYPKHHHHGEHACHEAGIHLRSPTSSPAPAISQGPQRPRNRSRTDAFCLAKGVIPTTGLDNIKVSPLEGKARTSQFMGFNLRKPTAIAGWQATKKQFDQEVRDIIQQEAPRSLRLQCSAWPSGLPTPDAECVTQHKNGPRHPRVSEGAGTACPGPAWAPSLQTPPAGTGRSCSLDSEPSQAALLKLKHPHAESSLFTSSSVTQFHVLEPTPTFLSDSSVPSSLCRWQMPNGFMSVTDSPSLCLREPKSKTPSETPVPPSRNQSALNMATPHLETKMSQSVTFQGHHATMAYHRADKADQG